MKKLLFLIILLLTVSVSVSANECGPSLTAPTLQLAPYIYQIISSDKDEMQHKLEKLQELIGVNVTGQHRSYPARQTYKKRIQVDGIIQSVSVIKPSEDPRNIIYQMTIQSKGESLQKFAFSGSYSPAFSSLETDQKLYSELAEKIEVTQDVKLPFGLLSVGLDTPLEVAAYKERLLLQGTVVFDSEEYPYYELSTSYEAPFVIDGEIWSSVEHYVQAKKFVDSKGADTEHVMSVRVAESPEKAIKMGTAHHPVRSDWEEVKDEVMFKALIAKFTQHKDLYDVLMDTDDALIVAHAERDFYLIGEHTERDIYWVDGEDGRGKSMLGELLMRLRNQFRARIISEHAGYAEYELSETTVLGYLLHRVESLKIQDANHLAKKITVSNMSDIEKIDRMQMILHSVYFFTRSSSKNHTSISEWITFVNAKYLEDKDFGNQLLKIGASFLGSHVVPSL